MDIEYVVDKNGEKHTGGVYHSEEEMKEMNQLKETRRQYFQNVEQRNILKINFEDILGTFYFSNYKKLLITIGDNTALAFRYFYLCTFADKDGELWWDNRRVIHKDFKRILELNRNTTDTLVAELVSHNLVYKKNEYYYVNLEYYVRKTSLPDDFKGHSARMIDRGIRRLYEQATPRYHAMLGKIVPLLEYVNHNTNILCTQDTIYEYDYTKIEPLSGRQICEICGRDPENSDVFLKELNRFVVDRLPFVRRIVDDTTKYQLTCYIINPYVVYMGSYNKHLEWTFKLFDLRSRGQHT